ncbi:MAG: peptidoglycan-binding domain-containing protein [Candidatus Omnitrophota bacterium]|nr:peptidoglycan-binding domain-containing protein [Candidatus Omnitrophota bacterium]
MAIRLIVIFMLVASFSLAGCLKKAEDEGVSMEPATEQTAAPMAENFAQGKSVSVESVTSQTTVVEKPSVQDIQQALKNADLYEGKIDGISGSGTQKAIKSFQSQNGLTPDGKVGPKTWEKLKEYLVK